jgi:hypothetical protein
MESCDKIYIRIIYNMSINGSNNDLSFHIFNVSEHRYDGEFDKIADLFEKSEKNLCMHQGEKAIDLYEDFNRKGGFQCDYVYYIKNKEDIIAFAFIKKYEGGQNIYTVSLLCSHVDKYKLDDEPAGIFLLNKIYDDFVLKEKGVLRIQPALGLLEYYSQWRTPSYSPFNSEAVNTMDHLLYFENIDNITDEMLYELVYELKLLRFVIHNIPGIDLESGFFSKNELETRIETIENDEIKTHLRKILGGIKYLTIEEYRNHIGQFENNKRKRTPDEMVTDPRTRRVIYGGKRKSCKKKKYLKRKSRKVRKSHKRRR